MTGLALTSWDDLGIHLSLCRCKLQTIVKPTMILPLPFRLKEIEPQRMLPIVLALGRAVI